MYQRTHRFIVASMNRLQQGILVVAVGAGLSACGSAPTVTSSPPAAATPLGTTSVSASTSPSATPSSASSSQSDLTKPFGSTFTWTDKVGVTVGQPAPFTPSSPEVAKMMDPTSKKFVVVDVTLKNGGDKPVDAVLVHLQATTGSRESKALFDTAAGIDFPTAKVLPGAELKWKAAFGVDEGAPFVLTVTNGFGNPAGIYRG